MMPLNHILRKCTGGYRLHKLLEKMYMDDIKLFAKFFLRLEILIRVVKIYSEDIRMIFWDIKMCHANNEKRKTTNDERNRKIKN